MLLLCLPANSDRRAAQVYMGSASFPDPQPLPSVALVNPSQVRAWSLRGPATGSLHRPSIPAPVHSMHGVKRWTAQQPQSSLQRWCARRSQCRGRQTAGWLPGKP